MKKRFFSALCVCLCLMGTTVTAFANNHQDSTLPTKFISYTTWADTANRSKTDDSSVYIKNTSGMDLWVVVRSSSGVNCTYNEHAIVGKGSWLMHNTVYEKGYKSCNLHISTAKTSVSGKLSGAWSPDSAGPYDYANPF